MFVKLDDETILDMRTGTVYRYKKLVNSSELFVTFNGPQRDRTCSDEIADGFWDWLHKAALKFGSDSAQEIDEA